MFFFYLQVLHQAMQCYNAIYVLDTPASACALVEVDDAELSISPFVPIPQAQPPKIKRSVKFRLNLIPQGLTKFRFKLQDQ